MRILLDMNIPMKYAPSIEKRGITVQRWRDVGAIDASDADIMEYASNNDYIVMTYDLDFGTILSITKDLKPSIAQIRSSIQKSNKAVELICDALLRYSDELNTGAILSIDLHKSRVRLLPL